MEETGKELTDIYFFWIDQLARAKKRATARFFNELELDLSVDQWILLKRLNEVQSTNQKQLSDSTFKDPASVTRTLDLLVKKDLVERKMGTEDRRTFELELTKKGKQIVDMVIPHAIEKRRMGLEGISREELNVFRIVAERMIKNFDRS